MALRYLLPAPEGEGLGVGSVISFSPLLSASSLITDPTPCPSPTMGGEYYGPKVFAPRPIGRGKGEGP